MLKKSIKTGCYIQRNRSVTLIMNTVINETHNTLKQSCKDCEKTLLTENEYSKLENSQPQIEKPGDAEYKIRIEKMKANIIREFAKVTNTDMKELNSYEKKNWKKKDKK